MSQPQTGSVAYLGPPGTFAHQALLELVADGGTDLTPEPFASVAAALDAVRAGAVAAALVPFENSVEGSVATTLDGLADLRLAPLVVTREVHLDVHFVLLARPGTAMADIRTVASHPHALAQCRAWLARALPAAELVATGSTSGAAREVAAGGWDAAVTSAAAGAAYDLAVLAADVADAPGGVTRFVLVAQPAPLAPPTGADRTTAVLFEGADGPGSLLGMLTEFAVRGVNLSRLESRPTGAGLGSYCFHLDCDGHLAEARVGDAFAALRRVCADVRFLGSYPRAGAAAVPTAGEPTVPDITSDLAYHAAAGWLAGLREGRHPGPLP